MSQSEATATNTRAAAIELHKWTAATSLCNCGALIPLQLSSKTRSGLSLEKPIEVGRAVDYLAHISDWLVHSSPNLAPRHAAPAFAEGVVLRQAIAVLERDLAEEIIEGALQTNSLRRVVWQQPNRFGGNQAAKRVASDRGAAQSNAVGAAHPIDHPHLAGSRLELGLKIIFQRQSSEIGQSKLWIARRYS